jgi:hypothetical protein
MPPGKPPMLVLIGNACYRNKIGLLRNMQQEPQKKNALVPDPPATPDPPGAPEEPVQVIRPEDEAIVVERLRELGYID